MSRAASVAHLAAIPVIAAVLLLAPRTAAAHDEPGHEQTEATEPEKAGEPAEAETEAEPAWELSADLVVGATTADVLTPGSVDGRPANVFDSTRISARSFLFGVERHVGEKLTFGIRMPFVVGALSSRTGVGAERTVAVAGNVELEAGYVLLHDKTWNLVATLELALPTAGGKEAPSAAEVAEDPTKRLEYRSYDRFAVAHAGSAVRGSYESALFEPGNLGIVPKIAANFHFAKLTVSPMVKLENLINVTSDAEELYINELVAGVRAGYRVVPTIEPGVHLWVRELHEHTHSEDSYSAVAVVEPYVRFPLGAVRPSVSAILPFAGDLAAANTFGIRVGVTGEL